MSPFLFTRTTCRGCFGTSLIQFLDMGDMPLAGGFLRKNEFRNEIFIPLKVHICASCGLVQILDVIDPHILFKSYCYISSVIPLMKKHFKSYATFLKESYLSKPGSSLLEFGCNDGALLEEFLAEPHIRILGIDPSENISQMAKAKKIPVITAFFTTKTARTIVQQHGKMDVVTGSNVFAHVDDVHEIIKAAKIVLSPEGVFIIEVHYLGSLMKEFQYDTIYHEHLTYYSVSALQILFGLQQMRIVDVQMLTMHGGGIRVIACRKDAHHKQKRSVPTILQEEQLLGLSRPDTFTTFGDACKKHRTHLISFLQSIKNKNASIVGYGAPGRGTMLLNYCHITNAYLDYVVDISPLRYGKYVPGVHLPIYHPRKVKKNPPNYILILAWNYAESILEQEKELRAQGVQFIIPFPTIGLL